MSATPSSTPAPDNGSWTYSTTAAYSHSAVAGLTQYMRIDQARIDEERGEVSGMVNQPLTQNCDAIKEFLASRGYRTMLAREQDRHIIRFAKMAPEARPKLKFVTNLILFVLTVFTTLAIGSLQRGGNVFLLRDLATDPVTQSNYWALLWHSLTGGNPFGLRDLALGIPFSFALILILGSHELGHFLTARRYHVDATLPYFLPVPHPLLGTMGAFIRIKSPIPDRRALIRLGVAGPLVGFIFAVPTVIVGMALSKPMLLEEAKGSISLGSSLLFGLLSQLFFPHLPPGYEVSLHPLAFAGWLGFFVTALNLIPLGQLDGGHVAYVALGRFRNVFRYVVLAAMIGLGFLWPGWFFWGVLVLILGLGHPPTMDEITPVSRADWILIAVAVVIFALTFIPNPFPVGKL